MKRKSNYVQCFYCEDMLNRPQGRAAHIRKAHPGAPYQPTPEQIAKWKESHAGAGALPKVVAEPVRRADALATQPAVPPLTPREHLIAAISEVKEQLDATRRQIPELESQLQQLQTSQERLVQNLKTLETALSAIVDGTSEQQLPLEAEAPAPLSTLAEPESPAPTPPAVEQIVRRHAVPRRAAVGAAHA